ERNVNGMILDYWDALWWACMDMTTVGSDINAITPIGRILSVALAGTGMMMLPIFTAYITDRISRKNKTHS
ncbi:MAG: potassium channel family protein, partial [Bacteroidales bacterium]